MCGVIIYIYLGFLGLFSFLGIFLNLVCLEGLMYIQPKVESMVSDFVHFLIHFILL